MTHYFALQHLVRKQIKQLTKIPKVEAPRTKEPISPQLQPVLSEPGMKNISNEILLNFLAWGKVRRS
jgi:hypothetical protein